MSRCCLISAIHAPLSVPDEELIHLCRHYSDPIDGTVHRETMHLGTSTRRSVRGAVRWVEVRLKPGKFFRNYYWLVGPLPGDQGRHVTVLHSGQPQQCFHCFRYSSLHTNPPPPPPAPRAGTVRCVRRS